MIHQSWSFFIPSWFPASAEANVQRANPVRTDRGASH